MNLLTTRREKYILALTKYRDTVNSSDKFEFKAGSTNFKGVLCDLSNGQFYIDQITTDGSNNNILCLSVKLPQTYIILNFST